MITHANSQSKKSDEETTLCSLRYSRTLLPLRSGRQCPGPRGRSIDLLYMRSMDRPLGIDDQRESTAVALRLWLPKKTAQEQHTKLKAHVPIPTLPISHQLHTTAINQAPPDSHNGASTHTAYMQCLTPRPVETLSHPRRWRVLAVRPKMRRPSRDAWTRRAGSSQHTGS